jgi:hypothetical protein
MVYALSFGTTAIFATKPGRNAKSAFRAPMVVVDGDTLTAAAAGLFTDHWERVK